MWQNSWLMMLVGMLLCFAVYAPGHAEEVTPVSVNTMVGDGELDTTGITAETSAVQQAISQGNWALVAGLILMLFVGIVRRFWDKIPKKYITWATAILATLASVGEALVSGGGISQAIYNGLIVATAAGGLWSLVGKRVFMPESPKSATVTDELTILVEQKPAKETPVEEKPAAEPVEEKPAAEPVEEKPAAEPVEEKPAEKPVQEEEKLLTGNS